MTRYIVTQAVVGEIEPPEPDAEAISITDATTLKVLGEPPRYTPVWRTTVYVLWRVRSPS